MARASALFVLSMLLVACNFEFATARELSLHDMYSKQAQAVSAEHSMCVLNWLA